ncbi:hypothetical protein [Pontimicrobium sp. SW4]|uniref:Uncharacterized protein n=1 Tax=Pontimicrobium sp. SW4 TaxID=3153519 RepID=A0AAU7BSG6_9FLAO
MSFLHKYDFLEAFNMDQILHHSFSSKNGTIDGEGVEVILENLEVCHYVSDQSEKSLILQYLEPKIIQYEIELASINDSINNLLKTDSLYEWKTTTHRYFFYYLKRKIEALKLWVEEKRVYYSVKTTDSQKLTMSQIALKCYYSGVQITRHNGDAIANRYRYNSGEKLYQKYTHFCDPINRKGSPSSPVTRKKFLNKIALLESVIKLLPKEFNSRAKDELKALKNLFKAESENL